MYKPLLKQKLFFFALDIFLILAAFIGAFYLRLGSFDRPDFPFRSYLENALWITPVWIFLLVWGGKYSLREKNWGDILRSASLSSLGGTMLFVLLFFFRREIFFSRAIVLLIFTLGTGFLLFSWKLEQYWERKKANEGRDIVRVLVIGANKAAEKSISLLKKNKSRHQPVAILAPFGATQKHIHNVPICGKLDALEKISEEYDIHEILLCDAEEQMMNLLLFAEGRFLGLRIAPEILGVFRENIFPESISGKTFLTLSHSPLFGWGQFWKRGSDLLCAVTLLVLLFPVFCIQKIFQGQKKLFRTERRIGAGGKSFDLFRYHSKREFVRDIPNILNVFKGEMSFVGPRPELPEEWKNLPAHFKRRMVLRPGMLGPWQLKKIQGQRDDREVMFKTDLTYIHTWSIWQDIKIIIWSMWNYVFYFFKKHQE